MGVEAAVEVKGVVGNNRYFTTFELTQRLDLVFHLIENIEIIPLIRGPAGSGKSTLALRLHQAAAENWSLCLLEAEASLTPDRLLANISRCFGWIDQQQEGIEGLVYHFEAMRDDGQIPVLLIDDAQLLPATAFITLLRLFERQRGGEPLISIVMFADEHIDLLLATPQLRIMTPQAIQIIDLPPLNREDATGYMQFLLQQEGVPVDMALDDVRLTRLYRASKGLPGPLGQRVLDALGERQGARTSNTLAKSKPILLGVLGVSLLGALLFFQDRINQLFEPSSSAQAQLSLETAITPTTAVMEVSESPEGVRMMDETAAPEPVVLKPLQKDALSESVQMDSLSIAIQANFPVSEPEEVEVENVDHRIPALRDSVITDPTTDQFPIEDPATQLDDSESNKASVSTEPAVVVQPEVVPPSTEYPIEAAVPAVSASVIQAKSVPMHDSLAKVDWIRSRPANHFTLQLLGVERLEALKDFVTRHGIQDRAFYYVTQRKGKPWYPLLWGDFPDKKSAIKGSGQLPAEVQRKGYWIRRFKELQAELNKN